MHPRSVWDRECPVFICYSQKTVVVVVVVVVVVAIITQIIITMNHIITVYANSK